MNEQPTPVRQLIQELIGIDGAIVLNAGQWYRDEDGVLLVARRDITE